MKQPTTMPGTGAALETPADTDFPQTRETQEKPDGFEIRYEHLEREQQTIRRDQEITYQIALLQSEGLQTLIDLYGPSDVFDTIKSLLAEKESGDNFTTLEVVKKLEADPDKRAELFEKMENDASQRGRTFTQWLASRESHENSDYDYFKTAWHNGENFTRGASCRIDAMKRLDSVLGRIMTNRIYNLLDSHMHEFAVCVFQFEEVEAGVMTQLTEVGNDVFRLTEMRDVISRQRTEKLQTEADALYQALQDEVTRISDELNLKLSQLRSKLLEDINKVGTVLHETTTDEANVAVKGALENIESQIHEYAEKTAREIAEKTAPLRTLMTKVQSLKNSR